MRRSSVDIDIKVCIEAVLFAVEAARTVVQSGVQPIEVVGRTNDEQTIVAGETIQLIDEEGSVRVIDEGVEVLQNKNARRHLSGFVEDEFHRRLFAHP